MESLSSLKSKLAQKEEELRRITVEKYRDRPLDPGQTDIKASEEYSSTYHVYTDPARARWLKEEIASLKESIRTYAARAENERKREEERRESKIPKFKYVSDGKEYETKDRAMAARYNAQKRFFGMSKFKQTVAKATGQWRKFEKLWNQVREDVNQDDLATQLDKMFR